MEKHCSNLVQFFNNAYDNYKSKETDAERLAIIGYAQKYLGMPPDMTMEEFMHYHNYYY